MRSIAERLGKDAMSLYTYLPGKAELLDLMHDHALGDCRQDYSERELAGRSRGVDKRDVWALYERHPWMVQVSMARPLRSDRTPSPLRGTGGDPRRHRFDGH